MRAPNAFWQPNPDWPIDPDFKGAYQVFDGLPFDRDLIESAYKRGGGISGFKIGEIKVSYNSNLQNLFKGWVNVLNSRSGNPAFKPAWPNNPAESKVRREWRQHSNTKLKEIAAIYQDKHFPNVSFLLVVHGTRPSVVPSVCESGFAVLGLLDGGFFGKGIYFTPNWEYAQNCYSTGALVASWVAVLHAFPAIKGDMKQLFGKGKHDNYDGTFAGVEPQNPNNPQEKNFYLTEVGKPAKYYEVVVWPPACMPRYLVSLEPTLLNAPELAPTGMIAYQKGLEYIIKSQFRAALPYLQFSASEGNAVALILLSMLHKEGGLIGPIDIKQRDAYQGQVAEKIKVIQSQAANGDIEAMYALGRCYELGIGVPLNLTTAFKCYNRAVAKNHVLSQCQLGFCYEKGIGVDADESMAVYYYKLSAEKGYGIAQSLLGFCYLYGIDVNNKDPAKGRLYIESAAKQGLAGAQSSLGALYEHGDAGMLQSWDNAFYYYQKAAIQGHVTSQYTVGFCYEKGHGVKCDLLHATRYYQLAAEQGHGMAKEAAENALRLFKKSLNKTTSTITQGLHTSGGPGTFVQPSTAMTTTVTSTNQVSADNKSNQDKKEECVFQ